VDSFLPTVAQRWDAFDDQRERDVAMMFDGITQWIRFRMYNPLGRDDAIHWRLELTPLENGELPAVGLIEDERIAQALAYIHDHFHESPNLSNIAKAVHLSPFHFHRIFSKLVGISPKQYLQSKQLQTARWLLRSTSKAIGDIAEATGFASHGHFTSTFHRVVGLSPSEYREKSD
jgi:AraC-like DNA-binding protein